MGTNQPSPTVSPATYTLVESLPRRPPRSRPRQRRVPICVIAAANQTLGGEGLRNSRTSPSAAKDERPSVRRRQGFPDGTRLSNGPCSSMPAPPMPHHPHRSNGNTSSAVTSGPHAVTEVMQSGWNSDQRALPGHACPIQRFRSERRARSGLPTTVTQTPAERHVTNSFARLQGSQSGPPFLALSPTTADASKRCRSPSTCMS